MKTHNIPVYQGLSNEDIARLTKDVERAYTEAQKKLTPPELAPVENSSIAENVEILDEVVSSLPSLLGITPSTYQQINAALKSGKQHLMFYGPPGTGKTTLAQHCARSLASAHTLITGSSDWSSQDVIGGYQPIGQGRIAFIPGVLLRNYDRPLIIDELNRCDIDKVIGPLFTVLSGQKTTLPYRVDVEKTESEFFEILPKPILDPRPNDFTPGPAWRLIATINSIDKSSLYQMSYALTRRFAWIYVDVPDDLDQFISDYLNLKEISFEGASCPVAEIWRTINDYRPIGPAPIIDWINAILAMDESFNLFAKPDNIQCEMYIDGFEMFLLPMLDGLFKDAANRIATSICSALSLDDGGFACARVHRRLDSIAV